MSVGRRNHATHRLFVGLALPDEVRAFVGRIGRLTAEQHGGRSVPSENLHITLDFVGPCDEATVESLCDTLREHVPVSPIRARIGQFVARPAPGRARLLALDVHDVDGGIVRTARAVGRATTLATGRATPTRPLWPHITVVRFSRPTRVRRSPQTETEHVFDISRVTLYDSVIAPGRPPRYDELLGIDLGTHVQRSSQDG